ncbi:toxin glutamine deamidase domain-containing protein [Dactylosporangium sp. NPDC050688]|uniref:toxin glutamine deamidase domain-containing protein n=1 Tax=Dactylosporangium sp. NPDC050688 TaxID=3157217 RepID=UPI0033F123EA
MVTVSSSTISMDKSSRDAIGAFTGIKLTSVDMPRLASDASALSALADRVRNLLAPELIQVIRAVSASVDGQTAARFIAQIAPFVAIEPHALLQVAELQDQTAEMMRGYLVEMDYLNRQALIMFIFMMVELAIAAAEAFFAPWDAVARVATTRTIIQTVLRSNLLRIAARSTAMQMLFMPGSSLLAQLSQMADHIRDGIDWGVVGKQALYGLSVAALSTIAGPLIGKATNKFAVSLERYVAKASHRELITRFTVAPVFEVAMEVGGGIGASLMVDHKYDPKNADGDAVSGAAEAGGSAVATTAGGYGRRGAQGLGFTPTIPRLRLPGGTGFTETGAPVLPPTYDDAMGLGSTTTTTTTTTGADLPPSYPAVAPATPSSPPPAYAAGAVPLVPAPSWAPPTAPSIAGWQQFQQDLTDRYGGLLTEAAQRAQVVAPLRVPIERAFAQWVEAHGTDETTARLVTALGVPPARVDDAFLAGVRNRAAAAISAAALAHVVAPSQLLPALPAEFDRQALRGLADLAAEHRVGQYFAGLGSDKVTVPATVRDTVAQQVRLDVERGIDAVLSSGSLSTVPPAPTTVQPAGAQTGATPPAATPPAAAQTAPAAAQSAAARVPAAVDVVRQATADLPARMARVSAELGIQQNGGNGGRNTFEQHLGEAAQAAQTQFAALAAQHAGPLPGVDRLAADFRREWTDGYRAAFGTIDPAATGTTGSTGPAGSAATGPAASGGANPAVNTAAADTLLPGDVTPQEVPTRFEWIGDVNPYRGLGLDFETNCVLTAIGTDMSLAAGVGHQVPPEGHLPVAQLERYAGRPLVEAASYAAVRDVIAAAGPGARGIVVVTGEGSRISHVINVTRTADGKVVFLDGQRGGLAHGPANPVRLRFVATTDGVGLPVAPAATHTPATVPPHQDLAGADLTSTNLTSTDLTGLDLTGLDTASPHPPMFTVASDGYCVLSAFIASNPAQVAAALGPNLPADLAGFLSDPNRVRWSMRPSISPSPYVRRITRLLQQHVATYLAANRATLPAEVNRRRAHFRDDIERQVRTLDDQQVRARLDQLAADQLAADQTHPPPPGQSVQPYVIDADFLPVSQIRQRYEAVRDAVAAPGPPVTRPQLQLEFINRHGPRFPVTEIDPARLGDYLVSATAMSDRRLGDDEYAEVRRTVANWGNRWSHPSGEFLVPLLAHATNSRVTILRTGPGGPEVLDTLGPVGGAPVSVYYEPSNRKSNPTNYNHYNAAAPAPTRPVLSAPPVPPAPAAPVSDAKPHGDGKPSDQPPAAPPAPPVTDKQLQTMAAGLPTGLRLQRAAGATTLHTAAAAGNTISPRVPAPTGPGPAILLDPTVTDPVVLKAALAGMRPQDTAMAVLHWPESQPLSAAAARDLTTEVLDPHTQSAMLSVPREALTDAPAQRDPLVLPLDADGNVTFFNARPQRYLFLPDVPGLVDAPTPFGLPKVKDGVYQLSDGWVVWDGGSYLWIGPATALADVQELLPEKAGQLTEPTVFLGWHGTPLPPGIRKQVGQIFTGMPPGTPARLLTSGVGLDRHTFDSAAVTGLPADVRLAHVPGGVLAYTGDTAPPAELHWSDLADPDRPRLIVHESVADPAAVAGAVRDHLGDTEGALQVQLAADPPGAGATVSARAAAAAAALQRDLSGTVELVLPVGALGRAPAGAGAGLVPVDARGRQTLPAAARAFVVPGPSTPKHVEVLSRRDDGGYDVMPGWSVTEHQGAVLFAEYGTDPDKLPPAAFAATGGVRVVVQPAGGAVPPAVAAAVDRLLSGVPEADRHVHVDLDPAGAGPDTTPSATPFVPPAEPNRLALALGDPKATLPDFDRVEAALRAEADRRGITVSAHAWDLAMQRLLNSYPLLAGPDGYLFSLGDMEVLVHLDPTDPQLVDNPAGSSDTVATGTSLDDLEHRESTDDGRFHANEIIQSVFQTGARSVGEGTTMRANRVRGDFNFDVPLGPTAHFGPKFNFTVNKSDQRSAHLFDAEKGRVLDTRADSTFYSYEPGWRLQTRGDTDPWHAVTLLPPAEGTEPARLVVAIPNHLLAEPAEQVTAILPEAAPDRSGRPNRGNLTRLPETFSASNLTGVTELYDHIVARLRDDGFNMAVSSPMRQELQRKLWNTETHLDEAVNRRPGAGGGKTKAVAPAPDPASAAPVTADERGYKFTLHDEGKTAAQIRVHARRHGDTTRVGGTSDTAHIEKVRTAIVGHGGEFTLGQSSGVSFGGGTELPLASDYGDPNVFKEKAKLGISAKGGVSFNNNDGGGATHASLNVVVSRYTGMTGGHTVQLELSADVSTSKKPMEAPQTTPTVAGSAVVRLSEPDAFDFGFGVDADAFKKKPTTATVDHETYRGELRNTGKHPEDTGRNLLPEHVLTGRGLGQSLADVDPAAVAQLKANLTRELVAAGFLPPDGDRIWSRLDATESGPKHARIAPATATVMDKAIAAARRGKDKVVLSAKDAVLLDIDASVDNLDVVDKLVSTDGAESFLTTQSQVGLPFTVHSWRDGILRTAEITLHARSLATDAVGPDGNSVHFDRLTDELHVVNLLMALGIAGQGASGNQGWSLEGGFRIDMPAAVKMLESIGLTGAALSRAVGAADRLTRIVNRPELLEYPGRVGLFNLPYEFSFTVTYDNGTTGRFNPPPVRGNVHAALLPLNSDPSTFSARATTDTSPSVLQQGVVYHLDTHGLTDGILAQLPSLTGTGQPMTGPLKSLANPVAVQSHFKEALLGQYSTDTLIEPGFFANTNAAAAIQVERIGGARFVGATPDKYVTGLIELYLAETANVASRSFSKTVNLPDIRFGRKFTKDGKDLFKLTFSESVNVKISESAAEETKRVGGLEMLKLAFNRAYAFHAQVDYGVRTGTKTQTGFIFSRNSAAAPTSVTNRDMIFLLPEPEALAQYAAGKLPVSESQLIDAMGRWAGGELTLPGNTVAGLLHHWQQAVTARIGTGTPDVATFLVQHELRRWANALATRHNDRKSRDVVFDAEHRRQFQDDFGHVLDPTKNPYRKLTVPPYLTRTGDRTLGHSGVDEVTLFTGPATDGVVRPTTTLLDAVVERIETVAPGLLGAAASDWQRANGTWGVLMFSPSRQLIGTLPGGLESLQATLAGQRANITLADMLHQHNGVTFYFIDRKGGALADVIEVKVSAALEGRPRYTDWVPEYGIENYGHAYAAYASSLSRALGWNITAAKFGFSKDGVPISGNVSGSFSPQGGRALKNSEQGTREQTVYDWTGHYRATTGARITIGVRRLNMHRRPLNTLLSSVWDGSANLLASAGSWAGGLLTVAPPAAGSPAPTDLTTKLTMGAKALADLLAEASVVQSDTHEIDSQLDFKIPRGLAEAPLKDLTRKDDDPLAGDLRPLPPLPGDVYVSGALVDDLFPAGRKLMAGLLTSNADSDTYRGSVALPGLLSRLNVDNHLPDMLVPEGYSLASHLFAAGASNSRVAMRLRASLHSLEVLSPIVNSTGTGRYAKFQIGAAATQSHNRWRINIDGELSTNWKMPPSNVGAQEDTTTKGNFSTGANRTAPMSHSATYEDNKRNETHIKMQGVTYLVRLRGRFKLDAVPHEHSPFVPGPHTGPIGPERFGPDAASTGWITGDVYVEMLADEVHELRQEMRAQPQRWNLGVAGHWPAPAPRAHAADLDALLVRATPAAMAVGPAAPVPATQPTRATGTVAGRRVEPGDFDIGQTAPHVALLIRDQLGNHHDTVPPLRVTANDTARAQQRYQLVLDWAVAHLTSATPGQQAAADLAELLKWQTPPADATPPDLELAKERTADIQGRIARVQPPGTPVPPLPHAVLLLDQEAMTVARGVAFELGTHIDYTHTAEDGTVSRYRIDPEGRVVPLNGSGNPVTSAEVVATLSPERRNEALAAGIDQRQLEAIYEELLAGTPLQMEAAAKLDEELGHRMERSRNAEDDAARTWIGNHLSRPGGLPRAKDPARGTARGTNQPPGSRAARARRLLAADLPPGWSSTGPLPGLPATDPLPGSHLWIVRPQGTVAAAVLPNGDYTVHDPRKGAAEPAPGATEAGKDAKKEAGKDAKKEAGKDATETGKDAKKEAGKDATETGKDAKKETGKDATTEAGKGAPHEETMTAAAFRARYADAEAVTLVEPDVLRSWLVHHGDWAASRQFAQQHRHALQADPNVIALAEYAPRDPLRGVHRPLLDAIPADVSDADVSDEADRHSDPVLDVHRPLLDAIRANVPGAAYQYLEATTPDERHDVLTGLLGDERMRTPAALRAMAALVTVAPAPTAPPAAGTVPAAGPARDAGMLRAVADILDPSVGPVARYQAIAEATWGVTDPQDWPDALRDLGIELNKPAPGPYRDLRSLYDSATDPTTRIAFHQNERVLAGLTATERSALTAAVDASGLDAAALAPLWHSADSFAQMLAAVEAAPRVAAAATTPPATVPTRPAPAAPDTLGRWTALTDWGESRAFLDSNRAELLSDTVRRDLQLDLAQAEKHDAMKAAQNGLLTLARYNRIEDGYQYLTGAVPPSRQERLHQLLSQPELREAAAIGALANLAATLPGPVDSADAAILRTVGNTLAGVTVSDEQLEATVRQARDTLDESQRQTWAGIVRDIAAGIPGARGAALGHIARRLRPEDLGGRLAAPTGTARADARERVQSAAQQLQTARTELDAATAYQGQTATARDTAAALSQQARADLEQAIDQLDAAEETIKRERLVLPGLQTTAERTGKALAEAQAEVAAAEAAPAGSPPRAALADLRAAVEKLRAPDAKAREAVKDSQDATDAANALITRLDPQLPGLRRQALETAEAFEASRVASDTADRIVEVRNRQYRERAAAHAAAQADLDRVLLADPPPVPPTQPVVDLDGLLADLARAGHDTTTVVPVLASRLSERAGTPLPPRLVLSTAPDPKVAEKSPADEAAVIGLSRPSLAGLLAGALNTVVEMRVTESGSPRPRSYLGYPGGEVVRLNSTGAPESLSEAIQRLDQKVWDDLRPWHGTQELTDRLQVLQDHEIENHSDFATNAAELALHLNRFQPHLARAWLALPDPASATEGVRARLGAGLKPMGWPDREADPFDPDDPFDPVDAADTDRVADTWKDRDPAGRARLMADLGALPGFTVQPPTQTRPDPPAGARVIVVAGSAVAAGVVDATTVQWYTPINGQLRAGSMAMLANWAQTRGKDEDIWYVVLLPDRP